MLQERITYPLPYCRINDRNIVFANINSEGRLNEAAVIEQGVLEFNEDYINYILVGLGTGYLHKSPLFENPLIELDVGDEIWGSEIVNGMPKTQKGSVENKDLNIIIPKEEAVKALLSPDIVEFMKESVNNGNTQIEMVAGKTELFTKGYLDMYQALTGEEISLE